MPSPSRYLLIIIGSLLLSITMFRSGLRYPFGLGFWGPNGHDAIWHISIINQIKNGLPPPSPVFSGNKLTNYHWGFDLFAYLTTKVIPFDILDIYFRILPFIFAILIGLLSYHFAFLLSHCHLTSLFFVLFNFFAGSFGWIITLIKDQQLAGESLFWSMQSASTLINPPYAMSLIFALFGLILWTNNHRRSPAQAILIGFVFGLITAIKIYAAIILGLSFTLYYFIQLFRHQKIFIFEFYLCLSMALTSMVIMLFLGIFSQPSSLIFQPLWFAHTMIESPDKFFLPQLASFRYNLSLQLFSWKLPFYLILEIIILVIFIIGNLGFRIFGLFSIAHLLKARRVSPPISVLFIIMVVSLTIPVLFIQSGTSWNTIQFLYYFLFFANYFLAQSIVAIFAQHRLFAIILIILTITGSYSTFKDYFGYPPPASLPNYEVEALNFLRQQNPGIILTQPYDAYKKQNKLTQIPLPFYETTAYVSAFTGKTVYLEDEMNLDITGYDWRQRRFLSEKFFRQTPKELFENRGFLLENQIKYIYFLNLSVPELNQKDLYLQKIFDNGYCQIYQVER